MPPEVPTSMQTSQEDPRCKLLSRLRENDSWWRVSSLYKINFKTI